MSYVAIETFFWRDPEGYADDWFRAGISRVSDPYHRVLRTHASCFKFEPYGAGRGRARHRGRLSIPTRPRWRLPDGRPTGRASVRVAREVPEVRADAIPTVAVHVERSALRTIQQELMESRDLLDDEHETGGFLWVRRYSNPVEIWLATPLGVDGTRRRCAVTLGSVERDRLTRQLRASEADHLAVGGTWHTHPYGELPSDRDCEISLADLERSGARQWLDLIVTRDRERGWLRPHLTPWVTRRSLGVVPVTEPARLIP